MSSSGLSSAAPIGGMEPSTDITSVVSTYRWVPTNWVTAWTLQSSTETIVANFLRYRIEYNTIGYKIVR